ncbi:Asp-tRNA(Asn)/Glu-tRNA(Gln) amidotransferase subunit GatB [Patescibacteria group bacterium]|nr:Asp-tRNA(Asn)/Glu-tRNA(Gln) amidotransferase subunit GatB [Patescibacteria group bacterium]
MLKSSIGLEIHTELKTSSKMFCSCRNDPDEKKANINVCPICMGHPGTLPSANKEAIKKVVKTGLALNCEINRTSKFDRKNYFYPDLPKGYQISQYDQPFCKAGYLEIPASKGFKEMHLKTIRITRIHLEEDTGRLMHPEKADYSLVDYNRAGIPLMELVTEPDLESGLEVRRFAEEFQLIMRYLSVSDADMEKGQMRVEVNISMGARKKLGTKVEIKNLNSFKSAEKAVDYEIKRQSEILKKKGKVIHETRGWNDQKGETFSQREKEQAHGYRYFPEPDLPPVSLDAQVIDSIKAEIPELPAGKRKRFKKEYSLDAKTIEIFIDNRDLGEYFEKVVSEADIDSKEPSKRSSAGKGKIHSVAKLAANYIITDLVGLGTFSEKDCKIDPENFAEFVVLINNGKITSKTAKQILAEMHRTGTDPSNIIKEKGLSQISDQKEISNVIMTVLENQSKAVEDYRKGNKNVLQFLAGQVMAATKGRANPEIVQRLLKDILEK